MLWVVPQYVLLMSSWILLTVKQIAEKLSIKRFSTMTNYLDWNHKSQKSVKNFIFNNFSLSPVSYLRTFEKVLTYQGKHWLRYKICNSPQLYGYVVSEIKHLSVQALI